MSRSKLALLVSIVLSMSSGPMFADQTIYSRALGKLYKSSILRDKLWDTPTWEPDKDNPPFSARQAIKIADERRRELAKDTADFKWRRISATIVLDDDEHCFWKITYEPFFQRGLSRNYGQLDLIVLMDGTFIEPVVSTEKNR